VRSTALSRELRGAGTIARTAVADVERARSFAPHLVLAAFDAIADEDLAFVRALGRMEDAPPTSVVVVVERDAARSGSNPVARTS